MIDAMPNPSSGKPCCSCFFFKEKKEEMINCLHESFKLVSLIRQGGRMFSSAEVMYILHLAGVVGEGRGGEGMVK
jgi:hypothetical protein